MLATQHLPTRSFTAKQNDLHRPFCSRQSLERLFRSLEGNVHYNMCVLLQRYFSTPVEEYTGAVM